jgi:predicted aspartyl protease
MAQTEIPLNANAELSTYYLTVQVGGGRVDDYLVDTGAGFMTITDATLAHLMERGKARFVRNIEGHLADGRVLTVPIYLIEEMVIGGTCVLRGVEAAVLPGASRGLFGLSALKRTSPFEFSVDPPALRLSNCFERPVLAISAGSAR